MLVGPRPLTGIAGHLGRGEDGAPGGGDRAALRSLSGFIAGIPQQQGSKRIVRTGDGRHRPVEDNKKLAPWRRDAIATIGDAMSGQAPFLGAVEVIADFRFQRPAGHYGSGRNATMLKPGAPRFRTSEPDLDKLLRALFDAITQAGAWRDDKLAVKVHGMKTYADRPGVRFSITALAELT